MSLSNKVKNFLESDDSMITESVSGSIVAGSIFAAVGFTIAKGFFDLLKAYVRAAKRGWYDAGMVSYDHTRKKYIGPKYFNSVMMMEDEAHFASADNSSLTVFAINFKKNTFTMYEKGKKLTRDIPFSELKRAVRKRV